MLSRILTKLAKVTVGAIFYLPYKLLGWIQKYILCDVAHFCGWRAYTVDPLVIRYLRYKGLKLKTHIQTFYDYWRISEYEKYAIEHVENDIERSHGDNKKIVYYEIGANVGYSVLIMSKLLENKGFAVAFEVEPTNFKTLCDNIRLNRFTNVTAIPLGIADKSSIGKFFCNQHQAFEKLSLLSSSGIGMHSLGFDSRIHSNSGFYNVALMSLDSAIREFSLPAPTHLFIDAYGAEETIVAGMKETLQSEYLKMIMVDIESETLEESKAHQLISSAGFILMDCHVKKGGGVIPDTFQTTYIRA